MIYELRIYRAMPGRLPALIARFQNHTIGIWRKHGIRPVGFWTTIVGESKQNLIYILAWENAAEREKLWKAFLTDPEWVRISTDSERDGQLVEDINNQLLAPTPFSRLT